MRQSTRNLSFRIWLVSVLVKKVGALRFKKKTPRKSKNSRRKHLRKNKECPNWKNHKQYVREKAGFRIIITMQAGE